MVHRMSSAAEFTKKGNAAPEKEQNIVHARKTKGKHPADGSGKKVPVQDPKLINKEKPMNKKIRAPVAGKTGTETKKKKY